MAAKILGVFTIFYPREIYETFIPHGIATHKMRYKRSREWKHAKSITSVVATYV
jgi:hypothetical protein